MKKVAILQSNYIPWQAVLHALRAEEIYAVFHYVPLHSSPAGERYGRGHGTMRHTDGLSERLVRLPLWCGLGRPSKNVWSRPWPERWRPIERRQAHPAITHSLTSSKATSTCAYLSLAAPASSARR